ncbi:MAG: universal stress protein [Acidimicrobiia bacterium]|nr:universal stress protein [Acidimicrobiia bacterium]MDH4308766.1 universal stress protein [Acidimicrobiia bacterium]MDH5293128.1 universal stress protein [Acidimicrobiia bacterium]
MTWNPRHVLAAVDGSAQSVSAAQTAVEIAKAADGRVTLITVVRPPEGWWGLEGAPPTPEAMAEAMAAGRRELNEVVTGLDAGGLEIETAEEFGDPASTIVAFAEEHAVDLVVVGRRGAGLVERMMLGSVADRLAHHAPCPVMIVP